MKFESLKKYNDFNELKKVNAESIFDILVENDVPFIMMGESEDIDEILLSLGDNPLEEDLWDRLYNAYPVKATFEDGEKMFLVWDLGEQNDTYLAELTNQDITKTLREFGTVFV